MVNEVAEKWGNEIGLDTKHVVGGIACGHCGHIPEGLTRDPSTHMAFIRELVVGFTTNVPYPSRLDDVVGAAVLRCPVCFMCSWFHTCERVRTEVWNARKSHAPA